MCGSHNSDKSSKNKNRHISFESEEDDCSDNEETKSDFSMHMGKSREKATTSFSFYWEDGHKGRNLENLLTFFGLLLTPEIVELISSKNN